MSFQAVRGAAQCQYEVADGAIDISLLSKRDAQAAIGFGVSGIDSQGLGVSGDRFIELAFVGEKPTEIVMSLGVVGIAFQSKEKLLACQVAFPSFGQCLPELGMRQVGIGALDR